MRQLLLLLAIVAGLQAQLNNWNGYLDTARVDTLMADTTARYYTKHLPLTPLEDARLVILADDNSLTGFGTPDSLDFDYGYQTGIPVLNFASSVAVDTAWDDPMMLGTFDIDSAGIVNEGTTAATGVLTRYITGVDTTHVSGAAMQSRWFVPEWDGLVRFWVRPNTENKQGAPVRIVFVIVRRIYVPMGKGG